MIGYGLHSLEPGHQYNGALLRRCLLIGSAGPVQRLTLHAKVKVLYKSACWEYFVRDLWLDFDWEGHSVDHSHLLA